MITDLERALQRISSCGGPVRPAPHPGNAPDDRAWWKITYPAGPERIPTVVEEPMTYLVSTPGTPAEDALITGALAADIRAQGCALDVYEYINLHDRPPYEVTITPRPDARTSRPIRQAVASHAHLPTAVAKAWLTMHGAR